MAKFQSHRRKSSRGNYESFDSSVPSLWESFRPFVVIAVVVVLLASAVMFAGCDEFKPRYVEPVESVEDSQPSMKLREELQKAQTAEAEHRRQFERDRFEFEKNKFYELLALCKEHLQRDEKSFCRLFGMSNGHSR